jgi:hypothetical protein
MYITIKANSKTIISERHITRQGFLVFVTGRLRHRDQILGAEAMGEPKDS